MDKKILDFIKKSRVSVLATVLVNGSPHVAAMHYSHGDNPLEIYFSVDKTSLKCQLLLKKKKCQASVVIGFSEQDWLTLQMDGLISIVGDREELKTIKTIHYKKNPNSQEFENDPNTIFLIFKPKWIRYTDFNFEPPRIILLENL
ncbi:hypothetical protein A3F57_04840 [Candidatus Roizmanbacteria bacterium RIFCSPHIGHO2_12_FULL_36_11]|nr:MAG: hypothetical protein A3F57_04840 [Candidatus Roizmanbacteria bacterium RIFCSPHIGHO2_12_FULL_36_11]